MGARSGAGIPVRTLQVARAANPRGTAAMWVRDRLSEVFRDEDFADWFPRDGRRGLSPARCRIDWKYALGLELDDPGFDHSVLSEFRDRIAEGDRADRLLGLFVERLIEAGLVRGGGRQRTDSTHSSTPATSAPRSSTVPPPATASPWSGRCVSTRAPPTGPASPRKTSPTTGTHTPPPAPTASPARHPWKPTLADGRPRRSVLFPKPACRACDDRVRYTGDSTGKGRHLTLMPQPLHEIQSRNRREQQTETWQRHHALRTGCEATVSETVRAHGLRHCRYRERAKSQCREVCVPGLLSSGSVKLASTVLCASVRAWIGRRRLKSCRELRLPRPGRRRADGWPCAAAALKMSTIPASRDSICSKLRPRAPLLGFLTWRSRRGR